MDVDGRGVVWAGCGMGGWPVGGAHGRDLGSTAPTPVDPGAARARHNPTEPSAGPAGDGGGGSRVLAGGAEGIRTPDPLSRQETLLRLAEPRKFSAKQALIWTDAQHR